jgi:hypothetical protein
MLLMNPTAIRALGTRVDVIAPLSGKGIFRTASYDDANTWQQPWTKWLDAAPSTSASPVPLAPEDTSTACAASGDGRIMHVCSRNNADPGLFYYCRTEDFSNSWAATWTPIGKGIFRSAPAMAASGDGQSLIVVGLGTDSAIWSAVSATGGKTWELAWAAIGKGTFLRGTPAVTCSADGRSVFAFGLGDDQRIWFATSSTSGLSWQMAWSQIKTMQFSSGPAAVSSADGKRVFVFARGLDNRMYFIRSGTGGASWDFDWTVMPAGTNFQSAPATAASWDAAIVHVFALGGDDRVWRAMSSDAGHSWATAWTQVGSQVF